MFSAAVVPADADDDTLHQLATYFEAQARALREAAAERKARRVDAVRAEQARAVARRRLLVIGARLHVLARRSSLHEALRVMAAREGWTIERLKGAHAQWTRERGKRVIRRRNVAIWKAKLTGETSRTVAERFGLTARMVDLIAARIERELIGPAL